MLSDAEEDTLFDGAGREVFRLEALAHYAVTDDSARFHAYRAGEPYDPAAEPTAWYDYIRAKVEAGVVWRKVHVLRSPLSEYLRFECEWSYPGSSRAGQATSILDLAEVAEPPRLPDYDFWLLDDVVVRMHYDDAGHWLGDERLDDAAVPEHMRYRDLALAASTPFAAYWAAHPQDHRSAWMGVA